MKNRVAWVLLLMIAFLGCGPAVRDAEHTKFDSIAFAGQNSQVTLHFEAGMDPTLKSNAQVSAYYAVDAFETQVFPVVQSAVGTILASPGPMDVWIFASAQGTVRAGGIEIPPGIGGILPDLTVLLTRAYYSNVPAYTVTIPGLPQPSMSFWGYVDFVNAGVMKILRFLFVKP